MMYTDAFSGLETISSYMISNVFGVIIAIAMIIARGITFKICGEEGWKTVIPIYRDYIFGKIANEKKWGIIYAISNFIAVPLACMTVFLIVISLFSRDKGLGVIVLILCILSIASIVLYFISLVKVFRAFSKRVNISEYLFLMYIFLAPIADAIALYMVNESSKKGNLEIDNDDEENNFNNINEQFEQLKND